VPAPDAANDTVASATGALSLLTVPVRVEVAPAFTADAPVTASDHVENRTGIVAEAAAPAGAPEAEIVEVPGSAAVTLTEQPPVASVRHALSPTKLAPPVAPNRTSTFEAGAPPDVATTVTVVGDPVSESRAPSSSDEVGGGDAEGVDDGAGDALGAAEGDALGDGDGDADGAGDADGSGVGDVDGAADGDVDGAADGDADGSGDGDVDGGGDADGSALGAALGGGGDGGGDAGGGDDGGSSLVIESTGLTGAACGLTHEPWSGAWRPTGAVPVCGVTGAGAGSCQSSGCTIVAPLVGSYEMIRTLES
jgi:hypothetical protein